MKLKLLHENSLLKTVTSKLAAHPYFAANRNAISDVHMAMGKLAKTLPPETLKAVASSEKAFNQFITKAIHQSGHYDKLKKFDSTAQQRAVRPK